MFCEYCGAEINDDVKFCGFCGNPTKKGLFKKKKKVVKTPHLIMLLDESGSMMSAQNKTIKMVNDIIKDQQLNKEPCTLTIHCFAHSDFRTPIDNEDLHSIKGFRDYHPGGGTPLFDAIGKTISKAVKAYGTESNVTISINTDGQENQSREFSGKQIQELIDKYKNEYGWKFIFVAEGIDIEQSVSIAASMGLADVGSMASYDTYASGAKAKSIAHTFSSSRSGTRTRGMSSFMDQDAQIKLGAAIGKISAEKRKKKDEDKS